MRMLAKVIVIIIGIVGAFFLSGFLASLLPPLPEPFNLIARGVMLVVATLIVIQIAGRIEKEIDRKP